MSKLILFYGRCNQCGRVETVPGRSCFTNIGYSFYICRQCRSRQILREIKYDVDEIIQHIIKQDLGQEFIDELEKKMVGGVEDD
jgi:hypothetical protein